MGTGMGFAVFEDGRLGPHLEMSQHTVYNAGKTYDQYVGKRRAAEGWRKTLEQNECGG